MKVITEAIIRAELKATKPDVYYIPEGKLLSPAAREYLNQMQVDIDFERNRGARELEPDEEPAAVAAPHREAPAAANNAVAADGEGVKAKYVDYETGAGYVEKPEFMTQLIGNKLVDKNHKRIKYRGRLDLVQADVVNSQCIIDKESGSAALIKDLDDILDCLRKLMVAEIMDQDYTKDTIIGLTHVELREHSHNPMKYYNIKQMTLPDHTMGIEYSLLNRIRAEIRETELVAVDAFQENRKITRVDIIQALNRLSSAMHIMMCKYLAGEYGTTK